MNKIKQQIEKTLLFLEPHLPLANVHMVDYFTKNAFYEYIPNNIREEAKNYGYQNAIQAILNQKTEHLPHLNDYIKKSNELTLKNTQVCLSLKQFEHELKKLGQKEPIYQKLDIFMNAKKSHEVEILSGVAAAVQALSRTSHLIDIGDGKGYLSSMLALRYRVPVLGVDASEINTNGAVDRANKLSKVWNGVVSNIKTRETSVNLYKQITKCVDEETSFPELISTIFLEKPNRIGLVGLHTCGNLTPTCLKMYNKCNVIKTICNVGCCYHHITEEFLDNGQVNISPPGFPLSGFLKKRKCVIGRDARMVAAQSVNRILNKKDRPSKTLFYRALFEIIIQQSAKMNKVLDKQVGRFKKECPTFSDYVKKAAKRISLPLDLTENDIQLLYTKFEHRNQEMELFYLIRAMLAPIVESLILMDRMLFLYENDYSKSFLVQLFDPVVSPRCYGIVSIKD